MSTARIRSSQNNSTRQRVGPTPKPAFDFDKLTPAQQEEFKKALAEKAKSDPKLKAAIVEGIRKQATAAQATPTPAAVQATPAPAAVATPPPTFSSRNYIAGKGWNLSAQPTVVSPRDAVIAKARANARVRQVAEQAAKQKAAEAAPPTQVGRRSILELTDEENQMITNITLKRAMKGESPVPMQRLKLQKQMIENPAPLIREAKEFDALPKKEVDAWQKANSVKNSRPMSVMGSTPQAGKPMSVMGSTPNRAPIPTAPGPNRELLQANAEWKANEVARQRKLFGPLSDIVFDKRPERFDAGVRDFIESRLGVPGEHAIQLIGDKTRIFTFVNDANGKLVSANTDTKGPSRLKKAGTFVGTFLSVVPTPVQPFAAAAMAIDGADQAAKDGDTFGVVINAAAAVTVGAGYASGAASAAGNTTQAANLANVATTAQRVGTVAQVAQAVENKDGLALLSAAGNAAVDFNIGVDPAKATKAITAVNLIHGAKQGDIAGVLRAAAGYARANGNNKSADILSAASVGLGVGKGMKDGDWNQIAMHLGLGLSDAQQARVRAELNLEPTRPDTNLGDREPNRADTNLGDREPNRADTNLGDREPNRADTNLGDREPIRAGTRSPNGPAPAPGDTYQAGGPAPRTRRGNPDASSEGNVDRLERAGPDAEIGREAKRLAAVDDYLASSPAERKNMRYPKYLPSDVPSAQDNPLTQAGNFIIGPGKLKAGSKAVTNLVKRATNRFRTSRAVLTNKKIAEAIEKAPPDLRTVNKIVSAPLIRRYSRRLLNGETPPQIRVGNAAGNDVIIDGNHRFVAGLVTGKDVPVKLSARPVGSGRGPVRDLKISSKDYDKMSLFDSP